MIDYRYGNITDIMPDSLKHDPVVQAIGYAISNMVKKIVDNAYKASIYAVIDKLDEETTDLLAVELRTKYYGELLTLEEKREVVKKTLLWYYKAGTLYTVQELTDFVFQDARVEEWFQYNASAYLFRLIVNVISQDISLEKYLQFLKSIYEVKNTRSHLEAVIFKYDTNTEVKSLAAGGIGSTIKIKTRLTERIDAANEDKTASVLFMSQDILIKADNSIKENEVCTLSGDGTENRVLNSSGSIVSIE